MEKIYVLYDPKCELCCRLKDWILVQRSWIGIAVMAAGSDRAKRLVSRTRPDRFQGDLVVINDEGAVYLNDRAWIMVLYAMVEYRGLGSAADASAVDASGAAGLCGFVQEPSRACRAG